MKIDFYTFLWVTYILAMEYNDESSHSIPFLYPSLFCEVTVLDLGSHRYRERIQQIWNLLDGTLIALFAQM